MTNKWEMIIGTFSFRYLYCDEIDLEADTVLASLYTAKKYIVPHLAREYVRFLETSLNADNVCVLLSQSRLFELSMHRLKRHFLLRIF